MLNLRNVFLPFIMALSFFFYLGCDNKPHFPTNAAPDTTGQDTTGHGGGNPDGNYGTIFFQSNAATRWTVTPPATINASGHLLGDNLSADTLTGSVVYNGRIDFARFKNISFLWRGGVSGGAGIRFYISSDAEHWQEAPYFADGDWQVAPFVRFSETGPSLTMRLDFRLPPGAHVRITDVRAYGK